MNGKKQLTNKRIVWIAVIGSLIVVAMMTANTVYTSRKVEYTTDEAVSEVSSFYLEAMADRRAKIITNLINNNFDQMGKAVGFIKDEAPKSQDELRESIGKIKSLLSLNRFAMVDEDDIVYTQYTTYTGRSRHQFLEEVKSKDRVITTVSIYGSSKQLCLAIPTPGLELLGKHFKACFVQVDISEIADLLALDDEGKTHFALYAKNGANLSGTELGPVILSHNIFDALKGRITETEWKESYADFQSNTEGAITFDLGEAEETLCYVPVRGTGWEMAVLIRESVIQDQIRYISERNLAASRHQIGFTFVSVLALALVLIHQLRKLSHEKLEEEKETSRTFQNMANTDAMTGVRNKLAYSENEAAIDSQIESGELDHLGVIIADINGLKHVNDTIGHVAGDQLIKDACALICSCFKQGAVFRIGGDEFAVILQGKGFDSMPEAISELNRIVEENIKSDDVVVSIGYSTYGPDDKHLSDVFERADKMMYERKAELKSMGAQTRH